MQIAGKGGVFIAGRATSNAEVQLVGADRIPKARFGVLIGKDESGKGIFANVVVWRELAEYAAGITKGVPVAVAGQVKTREYNGKTYSDLEAEWIDFKYPTRPAERPIGEPDENGFQQVEDDELPF